jgi:hypothetical protein
VAGKIDISPERKLLNRCFRISEPLKNKGDGSIPWAIDVAKAIAKTPQSQISLSAILWQGATS